VCATIGSKEIPFLFTVQHYHHHDQIVNPFVKHWKSANFDPEMENMPHHTEEKPKRKNSGCKEKKTLETGGKRCKL